ncbi:hypothetical protein I546_2737 [Mycobacterium kansasii 732]|nr:hypothetical protein I546_2737 [Mycobacterium kansasii 732]
MLIVFLAGAVLSRLAVRLARDVRPAPVTAPAEEPVAAADVAAAGVSPEPYSDATYADALTMPRAQKMPAASSEAGSTEHRSRFLRRHRASV